MEFVIRDAAISDYNGINRIALAVHKLHLCNRPDVFAEVTSPISQEQMLGLLNNQDYKIFVAVQSEGTDVIGFGIVKFMNTPDILLVHTSRYALIDEFGVAEEYKRHHIGKLLFERIHDFVKSEGVSSLQLNVWEFNQGAIAFYESMGMSGRTKKMELKL